MGEIFVAVARGAWGHERFFAIKKILPSLSQEPEFLARFRDEARLVIPLSHPNVVQVYEVGSAGADYFIVMEFVEGPNLGELLTALWQRRRHERLPVTAALYIIRELLAGLDYCHRRTDPAGLRLNVVHRDVSPSNVLLSFDGEVKLADFGLALSTLKAYTTRPNLVLGHLGYMAPEAMDGRRVDHRADIFCAGVLLFELLTCQRFVQGDDPIVIRRALASRTQLPPSALRGDLPPDVDELVARAVAENPEQRFPTARAFLDAAQRSLIRMDALYGPRRLAESVMKPLMKPEERRRELRALLDDADLEEVESRTPAARTVCIGEAIPLAPVRPYDSNAPVLTFINEVFEGDTEPMETIWTRTTPPPEPLEAEDTLPPVLEPSRLSSAASAARARRTQLRSRWPMRRRIARQGERPEPDLTPTPSPVKWLDVETVQ